jgi:hypothetical protein
MGNQNTKTLAKRSLTIIICITCINTTRVVSHSRLLSSTETDLRGKPEEVASAATVTAILERIVQAQDRKWKGDATALISWQSPRK